MFRPPTRKATDVTSLSHHSFHHHAAREAQIPPNMESLSRISTQLESGEFGPPTHRGATASAQLTEGTQLESSPSTPPRLPGARGARGRSTGARSRSFSTVGMTGRFWTACAGPSLCVQEPPPHPRRCRNAGAPS
ncbi:hypothetical protein IMZ48_22865 [Candidatus Bathyarchaeota archaeon]|nr:hypothetical protein [Candidatus Bathyarchaeota archaeon]